MTLEIIIVVAALVILAVTYWMFWAGLFGAGQALWIKRCRTCGHMRVTTDLHKYESASCAYCRHPWVSTHLMHKVRHNLPGEW